MQILSEIIWWTLFCFLIGILQYFSLCLLDETNAWLCLEDPVLCVIVFTGKRVFLKRLFCNWTGGYKWSTALALSITLGGFGADRFYLGQWREGLGKLFSFGGLGIWTLIDVLLIGVGYVGPADGSLYIWGLQQACGLEIEWLCYPRSSSWLAHVAVQTPTAFDSHLLWMCVHVSNSMSEKHHPHTQTHTHTSPLSWGWRWW